MFFKTVFCHMHIGPISQTLPRSAGASIYLKKGPLPPVPSIKDSNTFQQTPKDMDTVDKSQTNTPIPFPPPPPLPAPAERFRKTASFKNVRGKDLIEHPYLYTVGGLNKLLCFVLLGWLPKINRDRRLNPGCTERSVQRKTDASAKQQGR